MPPVPSKNCLIVAPGYGTIGTQVISIDLGMSVISNETGARRHRTLYPWKRTSSSFSMTVIHRSMAEFRTFNDWMRVYVERISDPNNNSVGPLRVILPARRFDRVCVPEGNLTYGRRHPEYTRRQDLDFVGASDAIQPHNAAVNSLSWAYRSTYHEQGGQAGDYLSNYAIAALHDAIAGGADFEDMLYNPKINPIAGNPTSPEDFLEGPDGRRGMPR